jgi:DNA polymerase-3 subunit gamma/tau
MSSAPSLYRRHRPRTFADVVGQEPVVRTLSHAVERGKVHHAYLFVGSRGTGKTSMAKILAACLNCERGGPTVTPCGECESCRAIAAASSLDVIEMDAASNNSVDDIRELRERVAFAPVSGRHKVYILDEAHMLSSAAWNAFLKTLEEPPPHTVFVLATTEAQKVPATVVDRCHRFDFQRPTVEQIASVLRRTAVAESIEIPPAATAAIARAATGSFRDALGTLEQLVTYSGTTIALEDVLAVLGAADADMLHGTLDAVGSGDAPAALHAVQRCVDAGRDAAGFIGDLEGHSRALLVVQTLGTVPAELALTPEADARLAEQAARLPPAVVVRLLDLLARALEAVRAGADGRTQLELALVKAATPPVDGSAAALLARLERLEAAFASGAQVARAAPPAEPLPAPSAPVTATSAGGAVAAAVALAPATEEERPAAEPVPAPVAEAHGPLDLHGVRELWPAVLEDVRGVNAMLHHVLADARVVGLAGTELMLAFPLAASFLKRKAEDRGHREAVAAALRRISGHPLRPVYELRELAPEDAPSAAPPPTEEEWVARIKAELDAEELHDSQPEGDQ